MARLTKRTANAAEPGAKRYTLFDDELKGFGLRVVPSGEKSWIVEYRPNGGGSSVGKRRLTLGLVGKVAPDEARCGAKHVIAGARLGADPERE